jgi:hypothetical protein
VLPWQLTSTLHEDSPRLLQCELPPDAPRQIDEHDMPPDEDFERVELLAELRTPEPQAREFQINLQMEQAQEFQIDYLMERAQEFQINYLMERAQVFQITRLLELLLPE